MHVKVNICIQRGVVVVVVRSSFNVILTESTNVVDIEIVIVIIHDAYLQIQKEKDSKNILFLNNFKIFKLTMGERKIKKYAVI